MSEEDSLKNEENEIQSNDQNNDFLENYQQNLNGSKISKSTTKAKDKIEDQQIRQEENEQILRDQDMNQVKKDKKEMKSSQLSSPDNQKINEMKDLLTQLRKQLSHIQSTQTTKKNDQQNDQKINTLQQQIDVLQIKIRLQQKIKTQKQLTSIDRINHLDHIFKHYCTHIFKTGKHMTFDRLQYEKIHLTIDRFFVFLKDFNLTSMKTKDGKIKEIVEKQEIVKLFKRVSPNCKDLNFEQFIIMIEKLGEIYFDSKLTYEQRKLNEKKQKEKMKQNIQKKEKQKQQMLKKHKQKMESLERIVKTVENNTNKKIETQGGQNDNLVEELMKQNGTDIKKQIQETQKNGKQVTQNQNVKSLTNSKITKSKSLYTKTFKNQTALKEQKNTEQNPLLILSNYQKREYFYQIINVDDAQSFMNKLRELNLPLFKIYATQNAKDRDLSQSRKNEKRLDQIVQVSKQEKEQEKRLKQLRQKLNERNQKLKNSSVPLLSKQQYDLRKLKRSRLEQQEAFSGLGIKEKKKSAKIDISKAEINLESLSKLSYDNLKLKKFDPKSLFSKQQDDKIFLKEYDDSPIKPRTLSKNVTQLSRIAQNTKRLIQQKDKNSQSFLQKLKHRQSQVEINEKKQQISQLYRFNDRNQRQKRLVDKFLQKNR